MNIDSSSDLDRAREQLNRLLDSGDAKGAISFAESLVAVSDLTASVQEEIAGIYIDAGFQLRDSARIKSGAEMFREIELLEPLPHVRYNIANAEMHLWELAKKCVGSKAAWLHHRHHHYESKRLFELVAQDCGSDDLLRLRALTNCGGLFQYAGKVVDAIDCFNRALEIDPKFGMALGKRGIARIYLAPLVEDDPSEMLAAAASDLDTALLDSKRVIAFGGKQAEESMRQWRSFIDEPIDKPFEQQVSGAINSSAEGEDPHLRWCRSNGLFLDYFAKDADYDKPKLDSVSFKRFNVAIADDPISRSAEIVDAFNAIKQDFVASRYLAWLAVEAASPIHGHADSVTKRVTFWDTNSYARWDVRTGLTVQALKATIDLLDKIACFVHLFLDTTRHDWVDFRTLPFPNSKTKDSYEEVIERELGASPENWGLMALIILSFELLDGTASDLKIRRGIRNAATHRYLVVHEIGSSEPTKWTDHINVSDLQDHLIDQLGVAKNAVLYLAAMINCRWDASFPEQAETTAPTPINYDWANFDGDEL